MRLVRRALFREAAGGAILGTLLFTFVLFLQRTGQLFEPLVRGSASPTVAGQLLLLVLPAVLPFAVPVGTLAGILIALGRMGADGEVTALRAAGIPGFRLATTVAALAGIATAVTAAASLWLGPWSIRQTYRLLNQLAAAEVTAEIQPRVFQEQFPDTVLYVADVLSGPVVRWRKIFLADVRPPSERRTGPREAGEAPRVTLAREAVAFADVARGRVQLSMFDGSTHEPGPTAAEYFHSSFPRGEQALQVRRPGEQRARPFRETDTGPLLRLARDSLEARLELHQRFALPVACLVLSLAGVPLGLSMRRAGRSAATALAVLVAFLYYLGLISLVGLARQGTLPAGPAVWTPNAVLATGGVLLLARLERPSAGLRQRWVGAAGALAGTLRRWRRRRSAASASWGRLPLLPQLLDTTIVSTFLGYYGLFLGAFVVMTHAYTFFELLGDILRNQIPMTRVLEYHVFLTPKLVYDAAPVSVMVATLVTFGVLTKHNEVMAWKACGVSVHRLALPVLAAAAVLSVALFAFDYYYVAQANRRQDAIRNEIKGRPVQTYLRPFTKWIFGKGSHIYHYKYLDPEAAVMAGVSVYQLDPDTFQLRRHVAAERARWSSALGAWVFENGWVRDIRGVRDLNFRIFQAATFPEFNEPPGYFLKEAKPDSQMNFHELAAYIADLEQGGFDTVRLRVQLHRKFSAPLFALVLAVVSVPFAFLTGSRGALASVGASFGIAIAYWAMNQLFEGVGNLGQLPPAVAAWAPNGMFLLAGLYAMSRMRT